jgi:hypothetical protein
MYLLQFQLHPPNFLFYVKMVDHLVQILDLIGEVFMVLQMFRRYECGSMFVGNQGDVS